MLVVLLHVVGQFVAALPHSPSMHVWTRAMEVLEPARMPLLLMVSGMLAVGAGQRPWGEARRRTWGLLYLFLAWTLIFVATVELYQQNSLETAIKQLGVFALTASSGYWYLLALVVCFIVAKSTRSIPMWIVLGAALSLALLRVELVQLQSHIGSPFGAAPMYAAILGSAVFFLIGFRCHESIARLSAQATWSFVLTGGAALIALSLSVSGTPWIWERIEPLISLAWLAVGIMAATRTPLGAGSSRVTSWIGSRTLPIYVIQFPLLIVLSQQLVVYSDALTDNPLLEIALPILVTIAFILLALLIHRSVQSTSARWMFQAPAWLSDGGRRGRREKTAVG